MTDPHWFVTSGKMEGVEVVIPETGEGPWITWREVVSVAAPTRREAIIRGVKEMVEWPEYARHDMGTTPFNGVTAEPAMCEHGYCWCEIKPDPHPEQDDYCELCVEGGDR